MDDPGLLTPVSMIRSRRSANWPANGRRLWPGSRQAAHDRHPAGQASGSISLNVRVAITSPTRRLLKQSTGLLARGARPEVLAGHDDISGLGALAEVLPARKVAEGVLPHLTNIGDGEWRLWKYHVGVDVVLGDEPDTSLNNQTVQREACGVV